MSSTVAEYKVVAYEVQKEKKRVHEANRRKKERDLLDKIREFILKIDPNHGSKLEKLDVLQQALVQIQQLKGNPAFACLFVNSEKMKTQIREQNKFLKMCVSQTRIARKKQPLKQLLLKTQYSLFTHLLFFFRFVPVTPVLGVSPSFSVFMTPPTPPSATEVQSTNRKTVETPEIEEEEEEIDVVNTPKPVWRPWI